MLRIEEDTENCATTLRLSGRIQADRIGCIRSAMDDGCGQAILDLTDITLVDVAGIRFLIACETEGVALAHCPPYVRVWMARERAESQSRARR